MFKTLIYGGKEYENFEIDEHGNVRNIKTDHIYKNSVGSTGYYYVYLPMGERGKVKGIRVHKAVMETFVPNPDNLPVVNHKDENKLNPDITNLEWTTYSGNTVKHFKICAKNGEQFFNNRKLTCKDVWEIRDPHNNKSNRELAKKYGVSSTTISNIRQRKLYKEYY